MKTADKYLKIYGLLRAKLNFHWKIWFQWHYQVLFVSRLFLVLTQMPWRAYVLSNMWDTWFFRVTLWARGVKDLWRNKLQHKWNRHIWKHCGNESISKAANYIIFIKSGTFTSYQTDFPKERVITKVFDLMSGEKAPKNCGKTTKTFVSFFWKMTNCYTKTWQNIFNNCSW